MKTVKTPAGTELPLMDIKGKQYLQVAHRIVWFREIRPDWSIETDCISTSPEASLFKATVKDEKGRVIATAHKSETVKGFPDHLEKSETGAIGRCLSLCGFGTQFTPELDEGDRLADSPQEVKPQRTPGGLSNAQLVRLDTIAAKKGISNHNIKHMAEVLGIKSRLEMNKNEYDQLITLIENYTK